MSYCGWESDKNNKAILYGDLYMGLPFTTHVGHTLSPNADSLSMS